MPETHAAAARYTPSSRLALFLAQWRLRSTSAAQRVRFHSLARGFDDLYRRLARFDVDPYITPLWTAFNLRLESSLLPRPRFAFLRDATIRKTMFVDARGPWLASQAEYLLSRVQADVLEEVLADPPAGSPPLAWARFGASHNSVHHLSHLERYRDRTSHDPVSSPTVVEWGGGYGNLARIFILLAQARRRPLPTYTIIDTPLLCCLQWLYLSTVFGAPRVHVISAIDGDLRPGCINIVPVGLLSHFRPRAELFISTWALSESSAHAQNEVAGHWFGARRLLLAFQESSEDLPDAGRIRGLAESAGAATTPVPELDRNQYAFR